MKNRLWAWGLMLLLVLFAPLAPCAAEEELDEVSLAISLSEAAAIDEAAAQDAPTAQEAAPADEVYALSDVTTPDDSAETRIEETVVPAFVNKVLDVARAEIGYTEGTNNFTKYGVWSGEPNAAWCAEFVCWCVAQADAQNGLNLLNTIYPNYSGQNTGRDWYIQRGRFVYRRGNCPDWGYQWLNGSDHLMQRNEYIPRAGDLVFFSYNEAGDTEHVALVEYCAYDAQGNVIIHVIEGNNPSSVQRNRYTLDNSQVLGFGACQDVIGTTMRYGNQGDKVTWLQESLHTLGLLEERHLTGAFGGNTRRAVMNFQATYMQGKEPNGLADRETQQALAKMVNELEMSDPDSWLVVE